MLTRWIRRGVKAPELSPLRFSRSTSLLPSIHQVSHRTNEHTELFNNFRNFCYSTPTTTQILSGDSVFHDLASATWTKFLIALSVSTSIIAAGFLACSSVLERLPRLLSYYLDNRTSYSWLVTPKLSLAMMDSSNIWNGQDPTLSVSPQDDFNSFLDMGMGSLGESLQFDFQDYSQQGQDTTMQEQMPTMTSTSSHTTIPGTSISGHNSNNESLVDLDAQIQYLQHQRLQQQQRQLQEQQRSYYSQHRMIPPTPNSVEMHAATSQFYPQTDPQHQAMYERYQMQTKEQEVSLFLSYIATRLTRYRWPLLLWYRLPSHLSMHISIYPNIPYQAHTLVLSVRQLYMRKTNTLSAMIPDTPVPQTLQ